MTAFYQQALDGAYQNHVLPFLWMKGESREVIAGYLQAIAGCDIHEVCLESRPHPDFCGEGWWRDLGFVVDECKKLGLKVWILDDKHFPTGYACGALEGEDVDPTLKKTVLTHRTLDVVGPTPRMTVQLANPFDPTECFVGAAAEQDGEAIELAFEHEGSTLVFDAPAGLTRVKLLFTSQKTGYRDEYINMVDAASCHKLIEAVYEPHFEHFGDEFGKTILGFFSDEPGFMNEKGVTPDASIAADSLIGKSSMALPWSVELERRLRERLGCIADAQTFFAHLARLWDREDAGAHVRHAYMDVATELYRECFTGQLGDWCRDHGVMYIGHVIEDKDYHARLGQGAGNYFRAVAGQDMAGIDVVINQLLPGMDEGLHSYGRGSWDMEFFNYALAKLGSSAAHLDPKKQGRCMAEVFGAFGWHEGLKEMKWICDHFLVRGVNWFVPHAFSMADFPDWDCPPHFYAHGNNPQFRYFGLLMSYLNRTGTLLSGGYAHTTAAVLYHADAEWAGKATPIQNVASRLARAQIDFDFVPAEAFADDDRYEIELADGSFAVNGQRYRCFVIPGCEYLGEKTLAFVQRAMAAGVPVFAVGALPTKLYDGAAAKAAGFTAIEDGQLNDVELVGEDDLVPTLRECGLYEFAASSPQRWLRCLRYSRAGEEYLFCVNEHPKQGICTTLTDSEGEALRGARVDPLYGGEAMPFDGVLELAPYESCLLVLGEACGTVPQPHGRTVELAGPWNMSFAAPLAYPEFDEARTAPTLDDLRDDSAYFGRCGTFRYETDFSLDADAANLVLKVADAYETLEVFVDGAPHGVRVASPYALDLGLIAAGEHTLALEVTNTVDKSVSDMFGLTEPSEPSGLFGPVELVAHVG